MPAHKFWGKLDRDSDPPRQHPLADHCTDVALTFRCLVDLPPLKKRLEAAAGHQLVDAQLDRLAVVAFLHDIGKCNHGFQAKSDPDAKETAGHVIEAAVLPLSEDLRDAWPEPFKACVDALIEWFDSGADQACEMLLSGISHHGRPVSFADVSNHSDRRPERWWKPTTSIDPMRGISELVNTAREVLPRAFSTGVEPINASPRLQQRFAGLVMLADWIGSNRGFFPYRSDVAEHRAAFAREAAARSVTGLGLARRDRASMSVPGFQEVFGFDANPLQHLLSKELPLDASTRLLLVESETGSGKTEAAFAWFLRLYEAREVDGLYFALPTRVAAREVYERILRSHHAAFRDETSRPGPVLLAAPGYVRVDGEIATILPDTDGVLWEDDEIRRLREKQWAAERPKRFLAAPLAVGTIDQALLSVLKVNHALLRSVCLDRSLLVVDEVHASDPYMRQTLRSLLDGHISRGGRALLLSATLGESATAPYFNRSTCSLAQAINRPYPSVTSNAGEHGVPRSGRRKDVEVNVVAGLEAAAIVPAIVAAVAAGARVIAVCNTVARANELLRLVEADGRIHQESHFQVNGSVCPHHGRFAREHREVMDAAVTHNLGKDSPGGGKLLVGTQTLEQSLDIDADLLITDLCPMDVLLQRIGRLHRHSRAHRPQDFAKPRVLVRAPADEGLVQYIRRDGLMRAPAGLGTVYPDGRILQRTLDLLRNMPVLKVPDQNRYLIEMTTHPEALAMLPAEWDKHGQLLDGSEMAAVRLALSSSLDERPFGEFHYPTSDERIATRLGGANFDLPLTHPVRLPFDIQMSRVVIPGHMAPPEGQMPDAIKANPCDEGFTFTLGKNGYKYTRYGLERHDA